ncbi:MAG: DUF922 domain-containing protein [Rhizobiales bacterium]|nr:DUF922 domain-containing protein [Hyphomicrobiales bacterium]
MYRLLLLSFLILAPGLAIAADTPRKKQVAAAPVKVDISKKFKYFKVRGHDRLSLFRDFQKKSPIKPDGAYDAKLGVTQTALYVPRLKYHKSADSCAIARVSVRTDIKVFLPQWVNYRKADETERRVWDNLVLRVTVHELVHVAIAERYTHEIASKISKLTPEPTCEKINRKAGAIVVEMHRRHDAEQRKFDADTAPL